MKHALFVTTLVLAANSASAGAVEDKMKTYVETDVRAWFADPSIVAAVQSANLAHAALSASDIAILDDQWKAEVGTDSALIKKVMDGAASAFLRDRIAAAGGKVTEIIVMDNVGLNVAISDVTSDYWQGDEDKFQKTFGMGAAGFHISEVELDESTQTYQSQLSFTLTDPATGAALGAVTVGVNAESF